MIVEALINLKDYDSDLGYAQGDILMILPENSPWCPGDLKGRIVVQIDLDLPCENGILNCSGCQYMGVEWNGAETLTVGDTASNKITCPKEKYTATNATYTFTISDQGLPGLDLSLTSKRRAYLDLSNVLSETSLASYLSETSLTIEQVATKLELARKPSNLVTISQIIEK